MRPVLPPQLAERPESAALAGWKTISVYLSAGAAGSRHVMVTLDEAGAAISAGDWVVRRSARGGEVTWIHESVGGRLERDGRFLGTRWRTVAVGRAESDEAENREQQGCAASADDGSRLEALAAELIRRSGVPGSVPEPGSGAPPDKR